MHQESLWNNFCWVLVVLSRLRILPSFQNWHLIGIDVLADRTLALRIHFNVSNDKDANTNRILDLLPV